jgi:hypothetical protein
MFPFNIASHCTSYNVIAVPARRIKVSSVIFVCQEGSSLVRLDRLILVGIVATSLQMVGFYALLKNGFYVI